MYSSIFLSMGGGESRAANSDRGLVLGVGVSENRIAGSAAARLFFLTAVAIAIATRPFKFHEISVSCTSSSFVSSIHSLGWKYSISCAIKKKWRRELFPSMTTKVCAKIFKKVLIFVVGFVFTSNFYLVVLSPWEHGAKLLVAHQSLRIQSL